jgi:hypothetical protein
MHVITISLYKSNLRNIILEVSKLDQRYVDIKVDLQQGMSQWKLEGYELKEDGIVMYRFRFYVINNQELKSMILSEMHKVPYVGHRGYQKTIVVIKNQYYWLSMEKEVVDFISRLFECQNLKAKHRHPTSFLHPL